VFHTLGMNRDDCSLYATGLRTDLAAGISPCGQTHSWGAQFWVGGDTRVGSFQSLKSLLLEKMTQLSSNICLLPSIVTEHTATQPPLQLLVAID
jgi:hypothetical protein